MKIGLIGVGRLGLPVAVCIERHGHTVFAFDINPSIRPGVRPEDLLSTREAGPGNVGDLKDTARTCERLHFCASVADVCEQAEIVFVAVQTPHEPLYEGTTRVPKSRSNFNYDFLCAAVSEVSAAASSFGRELPTVVISTVLPGTIRERILPLLHPNVKLCYNPFFIAMGTVWNDFTNPEFILLGRHDESTGTLVKLFYNTITSAVVFETTIENAELIKVSYNTFIGMKIAYANTIMEMCNKLPNTNVDAVTAAISLANKRLMSPAYLTGGMGDGGGCHPRDNIAMSWLSEKLGLSFNFFDSIMMAREKQTDFLADLICGERSNSKEELRIVILGKAFKPDTNLVTGSPSVLLGNILKERFVPFTFADPYCLDCDSVATATSCKAIFFIGCKHSCFVDIQFPVGSIVLDPHRFIPKDNSRDVKVRYIGTGEWYDHASEYVVSWGGE